MSFKGFFSTYYGLPRSIFILFIARIINCVGSFVYPFLTLFLTLKLGYSEEKAGFFVTGVIIAGAFGLLTGGKLGDRFGRKKIFIIFSSLSAFCFIICAFLNNSPAIPWILIVSNIFLAGVLPCINAMMTDLSDPEKRKAAFSLIYLGTNIGVAVGPLIAGFLFNDYTRLIFILDAATTILSLIPVILFVKETIPTEETTKEAALKASPEEKPETGHVMLILFRKPILFSFALISIIYAFVYSQHYFSLPIYLNEIFLQQGPKVYGTLMSANAVVVILMTVFLINILKKLKPILNIVIAGLLYAIGFGIIYFITNKVFFIFSTIIWTLGEIIQTVNTNVYIANNSPVTHRARFSGIFSFIADFGFIISPIAMGYFIKHNKTVNVWPLMAALAAIAAAAMYLLYIFDKNKKNPIKKD